jgi:hypothetical protein
MWISQTCPGSFHTKRIGILRNVLLILAFQKEYLGLSGVSMSSAKTWLGCQEEWRRKREGQTQAALGLDASCSTYSGRLNFNPSWMQVKGSSRVLFFPVFTECLSVTLALLSLWDAKNALFLMGPSLPLLLGSSHAFLSSLFLLAWFRLQSSAVQGFRAPAVGNCCQLE